MGRKTKTKTDDESTYQSNSSKAKKPKNLNNNKEIIQTGNYLIPKTASEITLNYIPVVKEIRNNEINGNDVKVVVNAPNTPEANLFSSTPPTVKRNSLSSSKDLDQKKKSQLFQNEKPFEITVIKTSSNNEDSLSLQDDNDSDTKAFVQFHKKTQFDKSGGKYDSLTPADIYYINNYCKHSLWRRAKFINDQQLGIEVKHICTELELTSEKQSSKYVDMCLLINYNMNYRRSYANKCMREVLIGKFIFIIINDQFYFSN
jgi:hypothetical protein